MSRPFSRKKVLQMLFGNREITYLQIFGEVNGQTLSGSASFAWSMESLCKIRGKISKIPLAHSSDLL